MILFTAKMVKLLLLVFVWMLGLHLFKSRLSKKQLVYLGILVAMFAFGANYVSNLLPPLTDTVKLTALGENRVEARGQEVYLNGYTIDGEDFLAGKSLEIESGHWFWSGETYAWRPETDSRQPDGVTREVILKIPVGWYRTLNFDCNAWRGLVQIDNGQNVWVEDTYTEDYSIKNVPIGRSKMALLIFNQLQQIIAYTVILLVLSVITALIIKRVLQNPDKAKDWLEKNKGKLIYAGIAFVAFLLMFHYAGKISFWSDELAQVDFVNETLKAAIIYCLNLQESSPPLALICSWFWYQIAPYGEQWTLILGILLTVSSIYLIGIIGEKIQGKYCGILAAIFMATSTTVWQNVAYEFRAYPFLLFFATLTLFTYVKRNENHGQKRWIWCFGVSMAALAMTHYFGMIACACYFMADFYLWRKKQIGIKSSVSYFIVGVPVCIWLAACFSLAASVLGGSSWFPVPKWSNVESLLLFVSGGYELTYWILFLGIACSLVYLFYAKQKKFSWINFYHIFSGLSIVFSVGIMLIYGNYINPRVTLWANRYFIFLLPQVYIISILIVDKLVSLLNSQRKELIQSIICLFFALILSLNCLVVISTSVSKEPYREAADWIYTQSNYIFNDDTAIIVTSTWGDGWNEYYITRQGRRDNLNVFVQSPHTEDEAKKYGISPENVLQYNRIYIQYSHTSVNTWLQNVLNENYTLETEKKDIKVRVYVRK